MFMEISHILKRGRFIHWNDLFSYLWTGESHQKIIRLHIFKWL